MSYDEQEQTPRLKGDKFKVVIVGVSALARVCPKRTRLTSMFRSQAGLGGLATAMAMAYAGYEVVVYEKIRK
jgi:hypothetical protein